MIDREHKLSIKRQAEVLSISRGTAYYKSRPVSEQDLLLMKKLDKLHLDYPFAGSRMLRDLLRQQDVEAGRLHIGTLMKKIGIEAIYRRPNTSKPAPGHRIYPYLLRNVAVTRPNQASATSQWRAASCISQRWWTGSAARFCATLTISPVQITGQTTPSEP